MRCLPFIPRRARIRKPWKKTTRNVRSEKFQFQEKEQNRNFGYEIVISVKHLKFIL